MEHKEYNGWHNWDTWNFKLLLDNDEPAYKREHAWALNFARKHNKGSFDIERAAYAVRTYLGPIVRRLEREYGTAPTDTISMSEVNFQEIAEHLRDEGIEALEYEAKA